MAGEVFGPNAAPVYAQQILSRGYSAKFVGDVLGRNDSLIGQVAKGRKQGANLESALRELRDRLPATKPAGPLDPAQLGVQQPARRTTKTGAEAGVRQARVRQKDTRGGDRWGVSPVKRQGTRNGARRLAGVLENARVTGRSVGWSVTLAPSVRVRGSGGKAPVQHKRRGSTPASQEVRLGDGGRGMDPGEWLDRVDAHDGNVTEAMAAYLVDSGLAESLDASQVWGLELRTWTE